MTGHTQPNNFSHEPDDLAELMQHIKDVIAQDDFQTAASLVEANIAAVWFGIPPSEMVEILHFLLNHLMLTRYCKHHIVSCPLVLPVSSMAGL